MLHCVRQSATTRAGRRRATAYRISVCARSLTEQHGLDGFTMEDLAEAAGVSRRTLFNYFPGKVDAVLGKYKTAGGFEPYDKLAPEDRNRLKGPVTALAEDLSTLRGKLGID